MYVFIKIMGIGYIGELIHRAMSHSYHQNVIRSFKDAEKAIKRATRAERPLVIKFYAPWCKPCELIAPWFESFSEAYVDGADFAIANIDHDEDIAQAYGICMIPAFHVWSRGVRVAVLGRDPEAIEKVLRDCLCKKTNAMIRAEISRMYKGGDEMEGPKSPIVKLELDESRVLLSKIECLHVKKRKTGLPDSAFAG